MFDYRPFLLVAASCSLSACDKPAPPPAPEPPPITVALTTHPEPLEVSGTVESKDGQKLGWKQSFDARDLLDVVTCQDVVLTLTRQGRIVEWDARTLAPKRTLAEFGAVTSIDARDDVLFAVTADGRLLRSYCDGQDPVTSPEPTYPALAVWADVRSKTRGFVVYEEPPNKRNKFERTHATVALVDFESGRSVQEPFHRPLADDNVPVGFVDYRGELWFGLASPGKQTRVWYLERFDETQPPLAGLEPTDRVAGFVQMSREVWAYGEGANGSMIYRVDSNRTKPMWDGKEGWFGERPGGELPQKPITAMFRRKQDVLIVAGDGAYRVDPELRRWNKLVADDPEPTILGSVTAVTKRGDKVYASSADGLIEFDERDWRRGTVKPAELPKAAVSPVAESVDWNGETWKVHEKKGVELAGKRFRYGPKRKTFGLAVAKGALWAFAEDGIWRLTDKTAKGATRFDTAHAGFAASLVADFGETSDGVLLALGNGTRFVVDVAK